MPCLSIVCMKLLLQGSSTLLSWLDGKYNPADIMSKHWGYQQIWTMLKPILFYHRDTAELYEDE